MIRVLAFCLLLLPCGVGAQSIPDRLETGFRVWMQEAGAERGAIAIWRAGQPQRAVGINMPADAPVELASLSKAITALCVAHLIETGSWTRDTTAREVLRRGPEGLTVAALLTHSAGIGPDQTQGTMPFWLDSGEDRMEEAARTALDRDSQAGTPGTYAYNNENYAILGAMIAAETGRAYADACAGAVLLPAGVSTAGPSPRTGGMAAWGGWEMSVNDYARLLNWAFGPGGKIGRAPDRWPSAEMGGGAFYGMGMTQRAFRGAMNYWHFGQLCFPGELNAGSYAVSWMGDWSVVVAHDACADWDAMVRLDAALAAAVFR